MFHFFLCISADQNKALDVITCIAKPTQNATQTVDWMRDDNACSDGPQNLKAKSAERLGWKMDQRCVLRIIKSRLLFFVGMLDI